MKKFSFIICAIISFLFACTHAPKKVALNPIDVITHDQFIQGNIGINGNLHMYSLKDSNSVAFFDLNCNLVTRKVLVSNVQATGSAYVVTASNAIVTFGTVSPTDTISIPISTPNKGQATKTFAVVNLPEVVYKTNNMNDAITLYAKLSSAPVSGYVKISEASIYKQLLY